MPGVSGIELYEHISDKYAELSNRAIFISGDVIGGDTGLFLKKTGRPFMAKPFNPDELITIVKKTLRRMKK
jgi:CheY-like chemotaxis protein